MVKTSKRDEPVFLLEMPHAMRLLVMKRGHLLRNQRTRTLMCIGKGEQKSWLEASLILSPGEKISNIKAWDAAHSLARKCKRELCSNVYVEPAESKGRFNYLTTPEDPGDWSNPADFLGFDGAEECIGVSMGGGASGASDPFGNPYLAPGGFGQHGHSGSGMFGSSSGGLGPYGMGGFRGAPHIPDHVRRLLPPQVREVLGRKSHDEKSKVKKPAPEFPALRKLNGFADLPESQRMMFEAEARQLDSAPEEMLANRLLLKLPAEAITKETLEDSQADERALATLSVNTKISATLKRFLLERFEIMTTC